MTAAVRYEREGEIGVIIVDNPPVNATAHAVREGLAAAFAQAAADDSRALVLLCAGRTFIAGADITEFGKPPRPPSLPEVLDTIEACAKPVVAAIHGTALGGGLETAMACHYRIALEGARLGLPEVKLGLLPGAGGTQRAPRLMGVKAALELMVGGTPVTAEHALACGLVDRVVDAELRERALAYARELLAEGAAPRRSSALAPDLAGIDASWFAAEREAAARRSRGAAAPCAIVDAVELAMTRPADEAAARTRELFLGLMASTESKAMRHLFFAEREAAKLPAECQGVARRSIERVAVIGGGTMGAGIAMNFADNGFPVRIIETDVEAAERAIARVRDTYAVSCERGRLSYEQMAERLARIGADADYAAAADADLVIEAVFEDPDIKREVFRRLDITCKPGAILATNTSYQDVNLIASATGRAGDVIGMHFFSPANVMKLLEVVRGGESGPDVVATVMELAKRIRKVPVLVGVCYGFVGNRMLLPYGREVQMLLLEGATPGQVDGAMERFGMAMGPCAVSDLAGLDVGYKARRARADLPDDPRYFRIGDMLVESGRLGQKNGLGFYRYAEGSRARQQDAEVEQMIRAEATRLDIAQREVAEEEIVERLVYALVNEAARVLEEGIARRASDIDVVYTNGYGFPVRRGGPMFYADSVGLERVYRRVCEFRDQHGPRYWEPAPLLRRLAESGGRFN